MCCMPGGTAACLWHIRQQDSLGRCPCERHQAEALSSPCCWPGSTTAHVHLAHMRANVSRIEPSRRLLQAVCSTIKGNFLFSPCCSSLARLVSPAAPFYRVETLLRCVGWLQGRRRLELFGEDHNIRPGWVTVGSSLVGSNFNAQVTCPWLTTEGTASHLKCFLQVWHGSISCFSSRGKGLAVIPGWHHCCMCVPCAWQALHACTCKGCPWRVRPLTG